jgi:hypothetical protein
MRCVVRAHRRCIRAGERGCGVTVKITSETHPAKNTTVQELIAELKQSIAAATAKVDELRGLL